MSVKKAQSISIKEAQKIIDKKDNLDQAEREYYEQKEKWLAENPTVKEMFDNKRIYDTEYVIQYLTKNKIGGHCALVYRKNVVCAEFNGRIKFPIIED